MDNLNGNQMTGNFFESFSSLFIIIDNFISFIWSNFFERFPTQSSTENSATIFKQGTDIYQLFNFTNK